MNACPRDYRIFPCCRFEPRYDKAALDLSKIGRATASAEQIEAMCLKTYVQDVCIRCGKAVDRRDAS